MDARIDCFVSGAFAVVLHVARFIGIAPLRFVKKKSGWRISPSTGWAIYGYIIITIASVMSIGTTIVDIQFGWIAHTRGRAQRVVWVVNIIILSVTAGTAVYGALVHMRCMIDCLNKVQQINRDLNIHHWPVSSEKKKIVAFILWVIVAVALPSCDLILLAMKMSLLDAHAWLYWMHSFSDILVWIVFMYGMVFIMITLHIMYSFRAINDRLRTLLCEIADVPKLPFIVPFDFGQYKVNKKYKRFINDNVDSAADSGQMISEGVRKRGRPHHETVRRLALAYAQACEVVRQVERCFGPCVLMMLGFYLLILVVSMYFFVCTVVDHGLVHTGIATYIALVLIRMFWTVFHSMNLVLINEPCHLTCMEIEITHQLVSHLMTCSYSIHDPLAGELELFYKQLILNQATYSPLKVTTLSRSLVVTILSSITTYLVVILQL